MSIMVTIDIEQVKKIIELLKLDCKPPDKLIIHPPKKQGKYGQVPVFYVNKEGDESD